MKHLANGITAVRIIAAPLILLTQPLSPGFYALYLLGGITDMVDGIVARKTCSESKTGMILDSIADLVFFMACFIRLLPVIPLPLPIWIWIGVIAVIRGVNVLSGYVCRHKFVMLHTTANRITGLLLFLFPLTIVFVDIIYPAVITAGVATFAAIQEGHFIRTGRSLRSHGRSRLFAA